MATAAEAVAVRHNLTPFEGNEVWSAAIEIPGAAGGLREAMQFDPVELHYGQEVFVVLRCKVGKVRHQPIKNTAAMQRVHILTTDEATLIEGKAVTDALSAQAQRIAKAREAAEGIQRIPGLDDDTTGTSAASTAQEAPGDPQEPSEAAAPAKGAAKSAKAPRPPRSPKASKPQADGTA